MGWAATVGTIASVIIGPILAFLIKQWWDKIADKAQEQARLAREAELAKKNDQDVGQKTGELNDSIDAQRKARDQWVANPPSWPKIHLD